MRFLILFFDPRILFASRFHPGARFFFDTRILYFFSVPACLLVSGEPVPYKYIQTDRKGQHIAHEAEGRNAQHLGMHVRRADDAGSDQEGHDPEAHDDVADRCSKRMRRSFNC